VHRSAAPVAFLERAFDEASTRDVFGTAGALHFLSYGSCHSFSRFGIGPLLVVCHRPHTAENLVSRIVRQRSFLVSQQRSASGRQSALKHHQIERDRIASAHRLLRSCPRIAVAFYNRSM
jgi:hypothetical protein